jgi:uncharacterized C2H2 Zn-finger protein
MEDKRETFIEILDTVHCVSTIDEAVSAVLKELVFCPFCSEFFTTASALTDHIKSDHSDRLAGKPIKVETYEVNEDAESIYICPHCHFAVDDNRPSPTSSIITHIGTHTRSIDPTARVSFQISKDKELIQTYVEEKVEIKLFCCSVCTDVFGDKESLLKHLYYKHSDADSKDIPYDTVNLIMECAKDLPVRNRSKAKHKLKYSF